MDEQRRQILSLLAENKITAEEAERLIDALEPERPEAPAGAAPRSAPRAKYLRVLVSAEGEGDDGPSRINVRVPLRLLRAGVRLVTLVPPQALGRANEELRRSGVPIDLTELRPEHVQDLVDQLDEVRIDVDDPSGKVQVFCE
ncbi:SHOCT-like domain-containing protein [Actinomadura harenae]|uniref:YvlB/LiaX N-terminal domain-containing protein n=1 Tax=Actinomadura harenae TaxID=2483351 RepID=A0A3M2LJR6_9ACTN|nr:hypothetical protein [Actinomadura harenae]RMI37722.1 hypothetical protein EBO15_34990 [Actinomadura harenae]